MSTPKHHQEQQNMTFQRLATVCLLAAAALTAHAQSYPSKPISIIVPFAPGGGIDVLTRAIGIKLSERWKQPVILENKTGAGSAIGTAQVARAAPDGYTLLATVNQTMVGNRFLYKKLAYDPDKSFEPISMMVKADQLIVVNAQLPASTLKEVVELARKKPGTINYGSYGNGSQPHLLFSALKDREKIDIAHIPYNGISPNLTALAAGDVQLGSASAGVILPLVQAGKIKPIAVAGDAPSQQFPNVTTTTQQGYPYAKVSIWYGLFAPAGTPPEIVNQIRSAVREVLSDPQFAEQQVTSKGLTVIAGDGKQLREAIAKEVEVTAAMIKAAGVVAE
jgi:tripartite-type tricarboxylate transporter receptor subunit TctC